MANEHIILTSKGLNSKKGEKIITNAVKKCFGMQYKYFLADKIIILFTIKEYEIDELLMEAALTLGFSRKNIFIWNEDSVLADNFDVPPFCYVSEGNTFQIAHMLKSTGADNIIKKTMSENGYYIGASAGAMLATSSICFAEDFDKNFIDLNNYEGLDLLPNTLGKEAE